MPTTSLQQVLPSSYEEGARLRLAPVFVVVARWSTDQDVIFVTSGVLSTAMTDVELIESVFFTKKNI